MKPKSQPNNAFPGLGGRQQQMRDRRASMYSQYGLHRGHAALPHEDQAHFHPGGLLDLDSIGLPGYPQHGGLSPGENGYFCGWDTLSTAGHGPSAVAENVLLVGYEGGLRVYRVSRKNVDIIGRLEGLRGAVIGAKILPWTSRKDPGSSGRPYIALTIHGPIVDESTDAINSSDESAPVSAEESSPEPSAHSRPSSTKGLNVRDIIKQYQTTVEVFSLTSRKRVATLYTSPTVDDDGDLSAEYKKPGPIGDLKVDANGRFVVVASGVSGEIFIFSPFTKRSGDKDLESMRCVGKLWTSVQTRGTKKPQTPNGNLESSSASDDAEIQHGIPLFTLSSRWIATVPPTTSSVYSLNGKALLLDPSAKPAGLTTHMAPTPPPPTTCAVDIPEGSEFMSRMSREVAQITIDSAKWIREKGIKGWNAYWSPQHPSYPQQHQPLPQAHFPPTHDYSNARPASTNDPTQLSIFDLQRFLDAESVKIRNALIPLATFEVPSGCSFLSFAPSGLHMVTVSKKGDEQFVWSLMKMRDPRSNPTQKSAATGPYVRQLKKFTRMTTAETIDIVWSAPHGERFSILTSRGTIHAHEIPASVFQWPPLRRARRVKKVAHDRPASPKGRLSSAVDAIKWAGAGLKHARSNGLNGTVIGGALSMTSANMSSKGIKSTVRNGFGAVANSAQAVYHAGDNKLHLGSIVAEATPGCMRWMTGGRDKGSLAIVAAGSVFVYAVKQTSTSQKGQPPRLGAKISKKPTEFSIHAIPDYQFAPALRTTVEARLNGTTPTLEAVAITGNWQMRKPGSSAKNSGKGENWHTLVEAETNPPYQPFHTDRRVSLYAFKEKEIESDQALSQNLLGDDYEGGDVYSTDPVTYPDSSEAPWFFGAPITDLRTIREGSGFGARTLHSSSGSGAFNNDDDGVSDDLVRHIDSGVDGEQVVVTTVRRKGREEEEFFEDDCEVVDFAVERV
jgi:hypothetical protein